MGAGVDADGWLREVADFLEDEDDEPPATRAPHAPFIRGHGYDPRGPGADDRWDATDRPTTR